MTAGHIVVPALAALNLHLDLDQNTVPAGPHDAGIDAVNATVNLPANLQLQVPSAGPSFTSANASCTVFGCEVDLQPRNVEPVWIAAIGQILVSYSAKSNSETPDSFQIGASDSGLCTVSGNAKFDVSCGWLLPAAKIDPAQLGQAAGTGALCISLAKGLSAVWQSLTGAPTSSLTPPSLLNPGSSLRSISSPATSTENKNGHSGKTLPANTIRTSPFAFPKPSRFSSLVRRSTAKVSTVSAATARLSIVRWMRMARLSGWIRLSPSPVFSKPVNIFRHSCSTPTPCSTATPASRMLSNILHRIAQRFLRCQSALQYFPHRHTRKRKSNDQGVATLLFGVHRYYPTLPDPYVASYTTAPQGRTGNLAFSTRGFNQLITALAGVVKWPDPEASGNPGNNESDNPNDPAYVYFRIVPLDQSAVVSALEAGPPDPQIRFFNQEIAVSQAPRNFQTGVRTFNAPLSAVQIAPEPFSTIAPLAQSAVSRSAANLVVGSAVASDFAGTHCIRCGKPRIESSVRARARQAPSGCPTPRCRRCEPDIRANTQPNVASRSSVQTRDFPDPRLSGRGFFMLLDVSSNADQMGVSLGNFVQVERDPLGDAKLRTVAAAPVGAPIGNDFPLQILNMDVVASAQNLRAVTLPQISWEPILNIPLAFAFDPLDTITTTPGLVVYDNDGIPTRIASESPYQAPIAPLPVTRHFLKEFNDKHVPRQMYSAFTLPFALLAQANFTRTVKGPSGSRFQNSFPPAALRPASRRIADQGTSAGACFPSQAGFFQRRTGK